MGSGVVFGALLGYGAYRTSANPKDFTFLFSKFSNLPFLMVSTVGPPKGGLPHTLKSCTAVARGGGGFSGF